ncbi:class I SAM-dependent methyltransferase [Actinorugispora endophytica]|uniref:Ubiquinone/menaquinone biosynthesis C-methylase UbiE n=1 Tax=Actinorugispora endophytica TaxID=1605990 RepID=A0A4R6V9A1_9ACTN|nr:class I SAM-dependent methyltransferase [Actinorugispora endophytica]TDQ53028.1 ubiquinone/menaquinone biosynthesis C-methylase UbiE [Actinorugispora endophytica]
MPENTPAAEKPTNEKNEGLYSAKLLGFVYTPYVIRFSHRFAWQVPNSVLHRNHADNIGANHLTVGPGNGYFLSKLPPSTALRSLTLMDLNATCLKVAGDRLRGRFDVRTVEQDALKPWPVAEGSLDSVDCHMMLHTVRGSSMLDKEGLIAEAAKALRPGGRFIGATILAKGEGVVLNGLATRLMNAYNGQSNTFANANDSSEDLRALLEKHFSEVRYEVHGCTGVWVAVK